MERARIIYNPRARNAPALQRLRAAAAAVSPAWEVDLIATEAAGHAVELAKDAAEAGIGVVFACGGDGTINEVVNGLAGTGAALGVIRGGMGNVFAKEIGVARQPEKALRQQLTGQRRRVDLGRAGERYFLLMAGIGFDAEVVRVVPDAWKKRLGSSSYALWGANLLARYRPRQVVVTANGGRRELRLFWALLGNTRSYGGILDITADAYADDGLIDCYLFERRGFGWELVTAIKLAMRRHGGAKGVTFLRAPEISIETPGIAVQVDGEYLGETPMRFCVEARALDVMLPPGRGQELFGAAEG